MQHQSVDHSLAHPDAYYAASAWAEGEVLHVAAAYCNPCRWRSRRKLFNDFRRHVSSLPNVRLHVGEVAFGDRPFEVTSPGCPDDVQLRSRQELWFKENLLNLVIGRFPADWRYGAVIDGDFQLTRQDLALEAIQQLQHYDWVQLFSSYSDLGPRHQVLRTVPSFAARWLAGEISPRSAGRYYDTAAGPVRGSQGSQGSRGVGATGGAWGFRREAFDRVGGLLDTCILGSGDWHMAFGLIGQGGQPRQAGACAELANCSDGYRRSILTWQRRAMAATRFNVGVVDCHAVHHFHGPKDARAYGTRWKILRDLAFDPYTDLSRDWQGLHQLTGEKPALRDAIRRYFRARNEDGQ